MEEAKESEDAPPRAGAGCETATLAGGCFWCLEAVFQRLAGVERVVSGYSGGHVPEPTYRQICTGRTGHAEAVQVTFDPGVVSYRTLLEIFFAVHDPTTRDRQGPDVGSQYRSAIFYHSGGQRRVAREVMEELEAGGVYDDPIVTELESLDVFYPAEPHHQDYYRENRDRPYCRVVIDPKLARLRQRFSERLAG